MVRKVGTAATALRVYKSKYTIELLEPIVKECKTATEVARRVGITTRSGAAGYLYKKIKNLGIDTSHFVGCSYNPEFSGHNKKKVASDILILRDSKEERQRSDLLKRALLEIGREHKCAECCIGPQWNNKSLTLHVDHINGLIYDDRSENLRFLCPNCHTQTENYCFKQLKKYKRFCTNCQAKLYNKNKSGYCWRCFPQFRSEGLTLAR